MRSLGIIGVVLVVVGVATLLIGHFTYSDTRPVLKAGPLEVNATEEHRIDVPTIGGVVILLAGVVLIVAGRRGR